MVVGLAMALGTALGEAILQEAILQEVILQEAILQEAIPHPANPRMEVLRASVWDQLPALRPPPCSSSWGGVQGRRLSIGWLPRLPALT